MKWVYLPLIFFLAFFYTKISFNNYQVDGKDSILIKREPGSVDNFKNKIIPFQRVPTSVYYRNLSAEDLIIFNKVAPFRGTIVGDVHVESFGYIIDDNKNVSFSVSDFSEVSEGALFHDVLGHLVSSKFLDKRISWFDYFESYKKGLSGEGFTYSFYTEKGLKDAFLDSDRLVTENITNDYPFEFTKLKHTHSHVDVLIKNSLQNKLTRLFPKIQFFDLLGSNNKIATYQALVRLRPQDKIQWLEIQESSYSDYDINFNKDKEIDFIKRFELSKKHIYSENMNQSLFIIKLDDKIYTAKFVEQFISNIRLDQIPIDDYHDIVMDEANVLGRIHAKSLGKNKDEYIKAWATISAAKIDEQIIGLKFRLIDKSKKQ